MTTVWPSSLTAVRRNPSSSAPERESERPVGSSAKTICGRLASARAAATRCCWPPDSCDGRCDSRSVSPTVSTIDCTQNASGLRPAILIGSTMFSAAVSVG